MRPRMALGSRIFALLAFLTLKFGIFAHDPSYAAGKKLTPEEFVVRHLASIGSPETLAAIQSRTAYGVATAQRPIRTIPRILPEPGKRTDPHNFLIASADRKLGMVMRFYNLDYQGEHFAFDAQDATVSFTGPNRKSDLGLFIDTHSGIVREGILGGILSTAWPLLRSQEGGFKLKYEEEKIDGKRFHQISYIPKSRKHLDRVAICFLFEFESCRHVMTEYRYLHVDGSRGSVQMAEMFGDFRNADGLMLPFSYSIECMTPSHSPARWTMEIQRVNHNAPIDPQLFKAP